MERDSGDSGGGARGTAEAASATLRRGRASGGLEGFVAEVQVLREAHPEPSPLADGVAERLGRLLRDPRWLHAEHREGWPDRYRQHVLYVAPDGAFSVVSLVWRPGQETPIHDHVSWCVVGVYQGTECETRYHLHEDARGRFLVPVGRHASGPGHTVALAPPDEDIHKVTNAGADTAISIHVYGADIGRLGTSINERFDHLPIRDMAPVGSRVRWRDGSGAQGR
jgi:predicted metal-dependent enzyme (double-stranded beta helix superfamily)